MIKYIHKVKLSGKEKNVINDQYIIPFVTCAMSYIRIENMCSDIQIRSCYPYWSRMCNIKV